MSPPDDRSGLPSGPRRYVVPVAAAGILVGMLYACVLTGAIEVGELGYASGNVGERQ